MGQNKFISNNYTFDEDTIVALCSPRGSGAVALIRLSGENAVKVVDKIAKLPSGKSLVESSSHTIHYGHVVDSSKKNEEIIDEVLFFLMHAPKTFTGQNTVEISCHNNQFIIDKIIQQAILYGARAAGPGEFTKRAFLSGKVDLVQAESINEIIGAQTQLALKKAMSQLKGSFSNYIQKLEEEINALLGIVEASFEFLDEEQRDLDFDGMIKNKIDELLADIEKIKINYDQQQQIREGVRISFLGAVNAGKSTLFNVLLKKDRSIVTEIAGTTRDSIECGIYRSGNFWTLVDTAGLRKTKNVIEKQGIDRSWNEAKLADIVLLIIPADIDFSDNEFDFYNKIVQEYKSKLVVVISKQDVVKNGLPSKIQKFLNNLDVQVIEVSALKNIGIDQLEKIVEQKVQKLFSQLQSPYLLNKRHYSLVEEVEKRLKNIKQNCSDNIEHEIVAINLRDILEHLSCLTGRNVNEKMLDSVFKNFCVGK
jgi:tRNA modification GTPase